MVEKLYKWLLTLFFLWCKRRAWVRRGIRCRIHLPLCSCLFLVKWNCYPTPRAILRSQDRFDRRFEFPARVEIWILNFPWASGGLLSNPLIKLAKNDLIWPVSHPRTMPIVYQMSTLFLIRSHDNQLCCEPSVKTWLSLKSSFHRNVAQS